MTMLNRSSSPQFNYSQSVFLDQSALISFMNPEDFRHWRARTLFYDLDDIGRCFITTNYVLFDIHKWLRNHYDYALAHHFFQIVDKAAEQRRLAVLSGEAELEKEAKQFLEECPNVQLTLSEAVTVVVMLRYGINRIFTFNSRYSFLTRLNPEIKIIPSL